MENLKGIDDLELELEPQKTKCSYISTGLSDTERDFPSLQDMKLILGENPGMTAEALLEEVERQISADKQKRMKREARRHKRRDDDDDE